MCISDVAGADLVVDPEASKSTAKQSMLSVDGTMVKQVVESVTEGAILNLALNCKELNYKP